jgi:hypothetical protein
MLQVISSALITQAWLSGNVWKKAWVGRSNILDHGATKHLQDIRNFIAFDTPGNTIPREYISHLNHSLDH